MKLARGVLLCLVLPFSALQAQEAVFSSIAPPSPDVNPPPTARAVYASSFNHEGMKANPASVTISIPRPEGTISATLPRVTFIPRAGYSASTSAGDDVPPSGFAYTWVGETDVHSLRVTFQRGVVAGIFSAPEGRFLISTNNTQELRLEAFPADDSAANNASIGAVSGKEIHSLPAPSTPAAPAGAGTGPADIDMLVLYTEEARVAAGGPAGQCVAPADNAAILAIVNAAVTDTDIAFANSLNTPRLGKVTIMRLVGFPPPMGNAVQARANASTNANIAALRNAVGADVVSVVSDGFANLGTCGVAFVQRPGCTLPTATPGCGVGAQFNAFAYNVVAHNCAIATDSFVHELGHNLGGEHDPANGAQPAQASFVFSFGHVVGGNFETVMSVVRPLNTQQELNFSHPNVLVRGAPTGIANQRHNALTIENLFGAFRVFRDGPTFADGFEDAAACPTVTF